MNSECDAVMECTDKHGGGADTGKDVHKLHNNGQLPSVAPCRIALLQGEEIYIANHIKDLGDSANAFGVVELQLFVKSLLDKGGRNVDQFKNSMPDVEWIHSFITKHENLLPLQMYQNILANKVALNVGAEGAVPISTNMQVDGIGKQTAVRHAETTGVVKLEEEEENKAGEQVNTKNCKTRSVSKLEERDNLKDTETIVPFVKLEEEDVTDHVLVETGLIKLEEQDDDDIIVNNTEHIVVPAPKDVSITQSGDASGSISVCGEERDPLENLSCDTMEFKCEDEFMQAEELVDVDLHVKSEWSSDSNEGTCTNLGKQGLKRKRGRPRKEPHKLRRPPQNPDPERRKPGRPRKIHQKKDASPVQPVGKKANSRNSTQRSKKLVMDASSTGCTAHCWQPAADAECEIQITKRVVAENSPSPVDSHDEGHESRDESSEAEDLTSPWPHLDPFYGPVVTKRRVIERGRVVFKGYIKCKLCHGKVSYNTLSTYTLKSHYNYQHNRESKDLCAAITAGSKRGRTSSGDAAGSSTSTRMRQCSTESAFAAASVPTSFKNSVMLDYVHNFLVEEMLPARISESPSLARLLQYCNPNCKLSSRRIFMRKLRKKFAAGKEELTSILAKVNYVATTADCWIAQNRAFLGMTVHWINPSDLTRQRAVLTCQELSEKHTFDVLGNAMQDVHQRFNIEAKVVVVVTDNGANFVKAFRSFGESLSDSTEDPTYEEDPDNPSAPINEEDDTEVREEVQLVETTHLLKEQGDSRSLPRHRRCAVHALNLLVTSDIEKVPNWSTGNRACFTKVGGKAQGLWNKQNRKPTTAAAIKRELGRKFMTPTVTRWNSLYDSFAVLGELLSTKMPQINSICVENNIACFNQTDREVITEYLTVMKPLAISLDKLQSESEAYMGVLLPTLYVLKKKLHGMKAQQSLKYAGPMVDYLLDNPESEERRPKGFKARFSPLFDDMDLLLAAAIHPDFKLRAVKHLNPEKADLVRSRLVKEVADQAIKDSGLSFGGLTSDKGEEDGLSFGGLTSDKGEEDEFFKGAWGSEDETTPHCLSIKLGTELDAWNAWPTARSVTTKKLDHTLFPALYRGAWVEVFLKFNTAIPSSAGVERVFSQGSDILRPKRGSLTSLNFERFVFLKGNSGLLKMEVEEEVLETD